MVKKNGITEKYLDSVFSIYIRLRDADEDGYVLCCNCGRKLRWEDATNGHFIKRRHRRLRWNELNCHAECYECNMADVNLGYAEYLATRYGEGIFSKLEKWRQETARFTAHERKEIGDYYKHKIKQLKKEKGL